MGAPSIPSEWRRGAVREGHGGVRRRSWHGTRRTRRDSRQSRVARLASRRHKARHQRRHANALVWLDGEGNHSWHLAPRLRGSPAALAVFIALKVSMPHLVWLMIMISRVPSFWVDTMRERCRSGVTTPPALRKMCALLKVK